MGAALRLVLSRGDWQCVIIYQDRFSQRSQVAKQQMRPNFQHLRRTKPTHQPVEDARGNAEALLAMKEKLGLKISLK